MLELIRRRIAELLEQRAAGQTAIDEILAAAEAENRSELTEDETARFAEARDAVLALDEQLAAAREREAELVRLAEARQRAADELAKLDPSPRPTTVRIGEEPRTYRPDGEHSFLRDVMAARFMGDLSAAQRLARHAVEVRRDGVETRDVGTGEFSGFVIPQYLTDLYAPRKRAGRPFLEAIRSIELPPEGLTVNIPRITTGTAVAAQATENSAVQETDIDDTLLAVSVRTYAGQQDVSRQALERGRMVEQVVVTDLIADYHARLDAAAISGAGTSGTHLGVLNTTGINAVTYTDATPTVGELIPKFADAVQQIQASHFGAARIGAVMHPRRWGWICAAVDTANRPLVVPEVSGPNNAAGVNDRPGSYGAVGVLLGVPVIIDANVPTNLGAGSNEDRIIVADLDELLIMEEPSGPLYLRFEDTNAGNLSVKLVVYGYSAFTAGRYPAAVSVISGTGLITPTF